MYRKHYFIFFSFIFLSVFWPIVSAGDDEEEEMCPCVLLGIIEDVVTCSGWEDAPVKVAMNMKLEEGEEDMPDMAKLEGEVDCGVEVTDGFKISINVLLDTPNGEQLVWSGGAEVCKSMSDEDAPWFPLLTAFNTTECPIKTGVYPVPGMQLNLDFAKGCLTKDFCGSYMIGISIESGRDKIMCFEVGAEIFEEDRPCSQCPNSEKK